MTTIYQVAEKAGVSLSTVSRVLNGNQSVNIKLRKKVEAVMQDLSYRPNSIARSLASSRSDSVGVLVSELNSPFFGEMMEAIEAVLRAANKHVIFTVGHNDLEQEQDGIDFLISRKCDALILHVEALSDEHLFSLNKNKIPLALVNRLVPGLETGCVCLNNERGGYLSTKHLVELGHKRIAYISGPLSKSDANQRLAGHRRALMEGGIAFDKHLFYEGDYTEESGADGITHFIENQSSFSALVCASDWMAAGAMTRARDYQLTMPDKLSIVGFDNAIFARQVFPKLTTIHNPIREMAEMAAKNILKRVYNMNVEIIPMFDPELKIRDSSKRFP
jgi:LacI family transcriptional regulator